MKHEKKKHKNKVQRNEHEAPQSFSQFVERTNDQVVGRSPSVLPVMEDLLKNTLKPEFLKHKRSVDLNNDKQFREPVDENDFTSEFPIPAENALEQANGKIYRNFARFQTMHSRYHRTVTILWWSIPFLILPILTLCVVTQMTAVKTVTIETSRHKQQVEIESEFNREVKLDAEKAENQAFIKDLRSAIK